MFRSWQPIATYFDFKICSRWLYRAEVNSCALPARHKNATQSWEVWQHNILGSKVLGAEYEGTLELRGVWAQVVLRKKHGACWNMSRPDSWFYGRKYVFGLNTRWPSLKAVQNKNTWDTGHIVMLEIPVALAMIPVPTAIIARTDAHGQRQVKENFENFIRVTIILYVTGIWWLLNPWVAGKRLSSLQVDPSLVGSRSSWFETRFDV